MKKIGRPRKWTAIKVCREVVSLRRYIEGNALPTLKEFSVQRKYSSQRWDEWRTKADFSETLKKEICEVMEMCKEKFTVMLIKGGLGGKLNKTIVIFALKNVAGWRDSQDPLVVNTQTNVVTNAVKSQEATIPPEEMRERAIDNIRILHRNGIIDLNEIIKQ